MSVRWSPQALTDLRGIRDYIARDAPANATQMIVRLRRAVRFLDEYPNIGRIGELPGTRELIVSNTPYIVVYRRRGDVSEILRVRHGAQEWPPR